MALIHLLRTQGPAVMTKSLALGFLLVTLWCVSAFSQSTDDAVERSFSQGADVNLFGLVDDLQDPDAFSSFRESTDCLDRLADFYNELADRADLTLLSSFDQPIPVRDFRGGDGFEYGSGTELGTRGHYVDDVTGDDLFDTKALQLNRQAFEFYKLQATGEPLPWEAIDYTTGSTPVILGHDYDGVYDVGDTFRGDLYSEAVTFEVVGFLDANSSIFYKDDIDFFLDRYIVVPYPERLDHVKAAEKDFTGILEFAMINADIAAPRDVTADELLDRLSVVEHATGFHDYSLLGVSPYLTQFTLTKKAIRDNFGLVVSLEIALAAAVVFSIVVMNRFVFSRRRTRCRIAWLAGTSRGRITQILLRPALLAQAGAGLVFAVGSAILPFHSPDSLRPVVSAFALVVVLDAVHQAALVAALVRTESGKAG